MAAPAVVSETRWLTGGEQRAWRTFIHAIGPLLDAFERDLAPHGLTLGDYEVLVFLAEADGHRLRMCDLAAMLRLSPSGLTRRLDGLVRHELVERVAGSCDRRAVFANLTRRGQRALEVAAPDHVASVRRHLVDRLDAAQICQLTEIFAAVGAAFTKPVDVASP